MEGAKKGMCGSDSSSSSGVQPRGLAEALRIFEKERRQSPGEGEKSTKLKSFESPQIPKKGTETLAPCGEEIHTIPWLQGGSRAHLQTVRIGTNPQQRGSGTRLGFR